MEHVSAHPYTSQERAALLATAGVKARMRRSQRRRQRWGAGGIAGVHWTSAIRGAGRARRVALCGSIVRLAWQALWVRVQRTRKHRAFPHEYDHPP